MIRRFFNDTRGSIPIMTAVMLVPMLIVSGAGIDFMRHEALRSKLQDSLDRGVLAAAALNQTMKPEETIRGYLRSANLPNDILLSVEEQKSLNHRRITANASLTVPVSFLGLAGVGDLTAGAHSIAEEARQNIELSLVLDVSGSMIDKNVFGTMKTAAQDFIGTVLRPEVANITSVNIVPFAGDVSVGKPIFDYLSGMANTTVLANQPNRPQAPSHRRIYEPKHTRSYCFAFRPTDFDARFPFFPDIEQTAHYSVSNYGNTFNASRPNTTKDKWWCPSEPDTAITVMGNDANALKARIGNMRSFDGTGTHIAMKWAMMLLDPVIRPYVSFATTYGGSDIKIDPGFRNRPADFNDRDTRKFIILMTDGETSTQQQPNYIQPGVYETKAILESTTAGTGGGKLKTTLSSGDAEKRMTAICTDAKSKGVTVFTIGFQITGSGANNFYKKLQECASSASHFYRVDDKNLSGAFNSIASAIQRIRLVRDGGSA